MFPAATYTAQHSQDEDAAYRKGWWARLSAQVRAVGLADTAELTRVWRAIAVLLVLHGPGTAPQLERWLQQETAAARAAAFYWRQLLYPLMSALAQVGSPGLFWLLREGQRAGWFAVTGGDGNAASPYVWHMAKALPQLSASAVHGTIMSLLAKHGPLDTSAVHVLLCAQLVFRSPATVAAYLRQLKRDGKVTRTRGTKWQCVKQPECRSNSPA